MWLGKHNTSSQCWLRKDMLERHKVQVMEVMYSVGACNLNGQVISSKDLVVRRHRESANLNIAYEKDQKKYSQT